MPRPFTLFTGQWADLPLEEVCRLASSWGYDGLELACWGDHFEVDRALREDGYLARRHALLSKYGLECWAISNHLVGQAVCDHPIDERHQAIVPARIWGDGSPEGVRQRAAAEIADTARAAAAFGVRTVVGFTGSSIWHTVAMFPPVPESMIERGYQDFADRWNPVLDVFDAEGVRFAHEVHPSEIAYDFWTAHRALDAVGNRPAFGLNFDPSHFVWQDLDPVSFLGEFRDRIYHVDCKEARKRLDGRNGRLGSHLPWGDPRRGWDFVSAGRGDVPWEDVFRMLNSIGYAGPISVEWEDAGMDRLAGAPASLAFLRQFAFDPPSASFDAAFSSEPRLARKGRREAEPVEQAVVEEPGDAADLVAGQGGNDHPLAAGRRGITRNGGVGHVAGKCLLPVGPHRDQPVPERAVLEDQPRQQARGGGRAAEPERPRRHGQPGVVGQHGDERGHVAALEGVGEPVDYLPFGSGTGQRRLAEPVAGQQAGKGGPGPLQRAVDRVQAAVEDAGRLRRPVAERVPQHQGGPLPRREVLQRGDERERD
jgi:sugar phosphate isomerase/epimerase